MKRLLTALCAGFLLVSCADQTAGTIGTGNTAGVAGMAMVLAGSEVKADVYIYKAEDPSTLVASTVTDSLGRFQFGGLSAGKYLVYLDQNGQIGMLSDTLTLVVDQPMWLPITLQPYALVSASNYTAEGFCAVANNRILGTVSQAYWKVPQKSGSYRIYSETLDSGYSVAWDSATRQATLYMGSVVLAKDSVVRHLDTQIVSNQEGRLLTPGNASAWMPPIGHQLRIRMSFHFDRLLPDSTNLAVLDDTTRLVMFHGGIAMLTPSWLRHIDSVPQGKRVDLNLVLDGTTRSTSIFFESNKRSLSSVVFEGLVINPSSLTFQLTIGNTSPGFFLEGLGIDLVKYARYPRIESTN